MDPFFPELLLWCQVPLENWRRVSIPKFQVHVDETFSDKNLETHKPIEKTPSMSQFLWPFVGLSFCHNMSEMAFVAMYTSFFRLVILTHWRMPELTWMVFAEFESAWNFNLVLRALLFIAWSLWGCLSLSVSPRYLRRRCRRRRTFRLWPSPLFPEAIVSWLTLHESPLEHCQRAFPLKKLCPLNVRFISFFDSWWLILVPLHRPEPWSFERFPNQTKQTQSRTILPGSHLKAFHSLIIVHDST